MDHSKTELQNLSDDASSGLNDHFNESMLMIPSCERGTSTCCTRHDEHKEENTKMNNFLNIKKRKKTILDIDGCNDSQTRAFLGVCREKLNNSNPSSNDDTTSASNLLLLSRWNSSWSDSDDTTRSFSISKSDNTWILNETISQSRNIKSTNLTVIVNGVIVEKPFPLLVYNMISKGNSDVIKWTHKGAAFKFISNEKATVEDMLQSFSLNNLLDFKRKLFRYGFRKYDNSYFHPMFHRDAEPETIAHYVRPDKAFAKASKRIRREKSIHTNLVQAQSVVTPSPKLHKKHHNRKVVSSPIDVTVAPSRRPLIPVLSPIKKALEFCEYECFDDVKDENVIDSDHECKKSIFFDDCHCFIEVDHEDRSIMSMPMTPLSINLMAAI